MFPFIWQYQKVSYRAFFSFIYSFIYSYSISSSMRYNSYNSVYSDIITTTHRNYKYSKEHLWKKYIYMHEWKKYMHMKNCFNHRRTAVWPFMSSMNTNIYAGDKIMNAAVGCVMRNTGRRANGTLWMFFL